MFGSMQGGVNAYAKVGQKTPVIKPILTADRRIRDLTMPRMARLSDPINHSGTEHRLANACARV